MRDPSSPRYRRDVMLSIMAAAHTCAYARYAAKERYFGAKPLYKQVNVDLPMTHVTPLKRAYLHTLI